MAFSRTVIPTPSSYAVVVGIGIVAGLGWNLLLGWPWWLGPIGFVVGAWLIYLSTAFRGPQRARTLRAIHDQFDPSGARQRHEELNRRIIAEATFAAAGFVDHPLTPRLGGLSHSDEGLTSITLVYGERSSSTDRQVQVKTSIRDQPSGFTRHWAEAELRRRAAGPIHLPTSDPSMLSAEITWTPLDLTLDGVEYPGERTELGDHWIVVAEPPDRVVTVQGWREAEPDTIELSSRHPSELWTRQSG